MTGGPPIQLSHDEEDCPPAVGDLLLYLAVRPRIHLARCLETAQLVREQGMSSSSLPGVGQNQMACTSCYPF